MSSPHGIRDRWGRKFNLPDWGTTNGNQTFANITATGTLAVTGATTLSSTLAVTGATTLSSTLGVTGATTLAAVSATTGAFSGVITSTVSTGTAPFTVASTTVVSNLNASLLLGATWAAPGTIGSGTPSSGAFTTLTSSSTAQFTGVCSVNTITVLSGTTATVYNTTATTVNAFGVSAATTIGDATTSTTTLRGGTLAGNTTTQNVFNATATTVNAFGAATTLNIGGSSANISTPASKLASTAATQFIIEHTPTSGASAIRFSTNPFTTSDLANVNFFRTTNTTAFSALQLFLGDNTSKLSFQHRIGAAAPASSWYATDGSTVNVSITNISGNIVTVGSVSCATGLIASSTTFAVANTVATTVNAFAAASTAVNIGNTAGPITFAGIIVGPASTTSRATARIPHGSAPTSPTNGDFWTDTSGAYIRINGVTKTFTLT